MSRPGPVGARPITPCVKREHGTGILDDEYRVQRSAVARLYHYGAGHPFHYCWGRVGIGWSRSYRSPEEAIAALVQQGFGAYIDLEGKRVRVSP